MTTYWIQNSDLSVATEGHVDSPRQVIDAFMAHDWKMQIKHQQARESSGEDGCPAGLGIVHPGGVILHLIPNLDQSVGGFWHQRVQNKILGFIPVSKISVTELANHQQTLIPDIISKFIAKNDNWLTQNLRLKDTPHE